MLRALLRFLFFWLRPRRPRKVRLLVCQFGSQMRRLSMPQSFLFTGKYSWKEGDLLKGQLVLPIAQIGVTSRSLEFKVGDIIYSFTLHAEAVSSEKFDVLDGDFVEGALVDSNQWGKSLPRSFSIEVVFPVDHSVPDQPGPVTLELSVE